MIYRKHPVNVIQYNNNSYNKQKSCQAYLEPESLDDSKKLINCNFKSLPILAAIRQHTRFYPFVSKKVLII